MNIKHYLYFKYMLQLTR